ncbi:hypothetical protein [Microbacterium elymi]|uniref:hypothetical protein n=1 Tax=Microbacterium elymi TaxID=2909587 RepID=UPI0033906854
MHDFWQFAGSYWWLIFPLMGVLGGAGKAWERNARSRHERRLEILHAKAEITSAKAAARGTGRATGRAVAASPASVEQSHAEQLTQLFRAHDAVTKRWLDYELDVAKLIAFPAMSDGRQPLTAAFLRAKKVADRLRPDSEKVRVTKEQAGRVPQRGDRLRGGVRRRRTGCPPTPGLVVHRARAQAPRHGEAAADRRHRPGGDPRRAPGRVQAGARRARRTHLAVGRRDRGAREEGGAGPATGCHASAARRGDACRDTCRDHPRCNPAAGRRRCALAGPPPQRRPRRPRLTISQWPDPARGSSNTGLIQHGPHPGPRSCSTALMQYRAHPGRDAGAWW